MKKRKLKSWVWDLLTILVVGGVVAFNMLVLYFNYFN